MIPVPFEKGQKPEISIGAALFRGEGPKAADLKDYFEVPNHVVYSSGQKEIMKRSRNIRGLLRDYHNDVDRIRITLDLKRGKKSVTEDHTLHYTFDVFKKEEPLPGAQFKLFPRV